ncbi:MAG: glycosyltransferase [Oscillospiraceae bacterium]|nr:glycosyltransferase [Oscillospiraceae bacterium]
MGIKIKQLYDWMKAQEEVKMRVKTALELNKDLHKSYDKNITLSISMILKNEEKMLTACLEGIKPLLDAVPSELVIIDTGSTDRTIEIAKQYTDKVFHFDWINDFGAARNFGLEKCTGQWFMFLDADDHFQDIADLIKFFSDEKIHKNYNVGYYITRNFTTMAFDEYFSFRVQRIARRTKDLRFVGSIHEYFVGFYNPAYYSDSYALHYGYAFESKEKLKAKSERNLVLLEKELEKEPDDLRNLGQAIACMIDMNDKKRAYIERALALAEKSDQPVSYPAYFDAYKMYAGDNEPDKALDVLSRAIKKAKPDNAVLGEFYAYKGWLLHGLRRYAEAEENIKKYLEYYDKNEKNKLDKSALGFVVSHWYVPEKRESLRNSLASCFSAQKRYDDVFAVYDNLDLKELPAKTFRDAVSTVFEIASAAENADDKEAVFKGLVALYEKVSAAESEEKINYFEQALEKLFYLNREESVFTESFKSAGGKFSEFMRLAEADNTAIENFINSFDPLPEGYSAAVELALKNNIDLTAALSKMNLELIRGHLTVIAQNNPSLPINAVEYQSDKFYFSNVKNLLFGALLFEAACLNAESFDIPQQSKVYNGFVTYSSLYVSNVYNPDLLNEDDVGVLSEAHRFGYYMGAAKNLLDSGDKLGYIRELKKALASCNSMQNVVKFLINEFSMTL